MSDRPAKEVMRDCQKSLDELKALLAGGAKPFDPLTFLNQTFGFSNETVTADKRAAENYRRPT